MSSIQVTKTLVIRLSIQALRIDSDPRAVDSEFEQIFARHGVSEEEKPRVRKQIVEQSIIILGQMALALEIGKAIDKNAHFTRELRLPEE